MNKFTPTRPDFAAWRHETLVQFAEEAYRKLQEQAELEAELRRQVKDAMKVIRDLNRSPTP